MAAKDGIPFSVFCTSKDLRRALMALNLDKKQTLPTCPKTIRSIVMKYSGQEREKQKQRILTLKNTGQKFCITFDEWTSSRNRR